MTDNDEYKTIFSKVASNGRQMGHDILVNKDYVAIFEGIKKSYKGNYFMTEIMRLIYSLNADTLAGQDNNNTGDSRTRHFGSIEMRYKIDNGDVKITYLSVEAPKVKKGFGLYPVSYSVNAQQWEVTDEPADIGGIDKHKKQQWPTKAKQIKGSEIKKAHYAAVAGRFGDMETAGRRMGEHIVGAYVGKESYLGIDAAEKDGNTFSMFWVKKGKHKSVEAAEELASIIQQSQLAKIPMNWLIHDHGTATFQAAAKLIKNNPMGGVRKSGKQYKFNERTVDEEDAKMWNVYFSNSKQTEGSLRKMCEDAGMTFVDVNRNSRDLLRLSTYRDVGTLLKLGGIAGSATVGGATGAAAALAEQFTGEPDVAAAMHALHNASTHAVFSMANLHALGGAILIGVGVGVALTSLRPAMAMFQCTLGKGNQKWYTDDKKLLGF